MQRKAEGHDGRSATRDLPVGLIGVHLVAPLPVGRLDFLLHPGLTALFGKNGVGKSRLLGSLSELFSSGSYAFFDEDPQPESSSARALYFCSGLHYLWPLSRRP